MMECDGCGFETENLKLYPLNWHEPEGEKLQLCTVCAGAPIGNALRYRSDNFSLFKTVGYVTNMILARLDEIEKKLDKLLEGSNGE